MIPYTFDSNVEKEEAQNNFKCVLVLMEVFVVIKIRKRIVTYHRCMNCGLRSGKLSEDQHAIP